MADTRGIISALPPTHLVGDTTIVCLRLSPTFIAKSYYPKTIIDDVAWVDVGSRRWRTETPDPKDPTKMVIEYGKTLFLRGTMWHLDQLLRKLELSIGQLSGSWISDIRKIEQIDLLSADEIEVGFPEGWNRGKVDVLLHPYDELSEKAVAVVTSRLEEAGVSPDGIKVRQSKSGLIYINSDVEYPVLESLHLVNPIRAVTPSQTIHLPEVRYSGEQPGPKPPDNHFSPTYFIGMFDGGVDVNNPYILGFATESDQVATDRETRYVEHGTSVAGALLYGPLNNEPPDQELRVPPVGVHSFRVLPCTDDVDLHDVVDAIEGIVPSRDDIEVYNISVGPSGSIEDDFVSRFTEITDALAYEHRKLFVVAVGNDGDLPGGLARIQAPADGVNHVAVGAVVPEVSGSSLSRAHYSCIGPGREGAKVKPDIVAFGGSNAWPFYLVGDKGGTVRLSRGGTSFSTPIVTRTLGAYLSRARDATPLLAKASLIHLAKPLGHCPNFEIGWGLCPPDVDDMMRCAESEITVVCAGTLPPSTKLKIPIPMPDVSGSNRLVMLKWTAAIQAPPAPLHPDDYTAHTVETYLYPHSNKYRFTLRDSKTPGYPVLSTKVLDVFKHALLAKELQQQGYKKSTMPVTRSVNPFAKEAERRLNLKWDTIVRRQENLRGSSLHQPFFVLHALGRGGEVSDVPVHYALVVSLRAPWYDGDFYMETVKAWPKLQPLQIRSEAEVMIRV